MAKPSKTGSDEKVRVVLSVLAGDCSASEAAQLSGVSEQSIHNWKRAFIAGGQAAFERRARPRSSREVELEAENEEFKAALGEAFLKVRMLERGKKPLVMPQGVV